jgi:hypothetical protein
MANDDIRGQDWFYYSPPRKSGFPKGAPPASQISGLNGVAEDPYLAREDDKSSRRRAIHDTDSKYVKMAKQGGRKDLLSYREAPKTSEKPLGYPWPDWFDYRGENSKDDDQDRPAPYRPDWAVHVEHKPSLGDEVALPDIRAPFRWNASFQEKATDRKKKVKKSPPKPPTQSHAVVKHQKGQIKLPPLDCGPVSFQRLMSMDYQKEWFSARDKHEQERQVKARAQQAHKHELTMKSVQSKKKTVNVEDTSKQELFKLTRYVIQLAIFLFN